MIDREKLLATKQKALAMVDDGDLKGALTLLHTTHADHPAIELGLALQIAGHLETEGEVREWIAGFNA